MSPLQWHVCGVNELTLDQMISPDVKEASLWGKDLRPKRDPHIPFYSFYSDVTLILIIPSVYQTFKLCEKLQRLL